MVQNHGENDDATAVEDSLRNNTSDPEAESCPACGEANAQQLTETSEASTGTTPESDGSVEGLDSIGLGHSPLNDRLVKTYLDEVLLMLILVHDGACGQDLIQDLYRLGCGLSPGTIYPHLHDLADDGFLEMHEQRRTKQFEVTDTEEVHARIEDVFDDLGTLSAVFRLRDSDSKEDTEVTIKS